jgi:Tfp pilus assembly protein PilV
MNTVMRTRGFALIDALVALAVLSIGLLALTVWQLSLSRQAALAQQRSQAADIAQQATASMRAFETLRAAPNRRAFDDIASSVTADIVVPGSPVRFARQVQVTPAEAGAKQVRVTVSWHDRLGNEQQYTQDSLIAASDPSDSGSHAIATGEPIVRPGQRGSFIPLGAKDLGNGHSGYKPDAAWTQAFVFDHATGLVRLCAAPMGSTTRTLDARIVDDCQGVPGRVVAGAIRTTASDGAAPLSPQRVSGIVFEQLDADGHSNATVAANAGPLTPACLFTARRDDVAPHPDLDSRDVNWFMCLVVPQRNTTPPAWSGRLNLAGATLPAGASVCRLGPARTPRPATYRAVRENLFDQNFIVVNTTLCAPNFAQAERATARPLPSVQHQACMAVGVCPSSDP